MIINYVVRTYKLARYWVAASVMILVVAAPYLEKAFNTTDLRLSILAACPLMLLLLLNDWRLEIFKKLSDLAETATNPEPPIFSNFTTVQPVLDREIDLAMSRGGLTRIDVIGVSAKYSWPYLQDKLERLLAFDPRSLALQIRVCVAEPKHLREWGLEGWAEESEHATKKFRQYIESHCESLVKAGVSVTLCEYDNLPHWHGVMVNGRQLFLGRTEWFPDGDDEGWNLRVGQVEYRQFSIEDHYGGLPRIERFKLWHTRYVNRADEIGKVHGCTNWAENSPPQYLVAQGDGLS